MCRKCAVLIIVVYSLCLKTPNASGQIIEDREYRGRTITCMLSGLHGWGSRCGADQNYAYIFVGSVLSVTEISDDEKRIDITPEEVFLGNAPSQLVALTNQGACLPEVLPGQEWLFYLSRDDRTKQLTLAYGSPSAPLADSQQTITRLRRLAQMSDSGMIIGSVQRTVDVRDEDGAASTQYVDVPSHRVVATRKRDGKKIYAFTDTAGEFEFEALAPGQYELTANTADGLWTEEGPTTVEPHSCTAFQFELHVDGTISGHVERLDGRSFQIHPWVEVNREDGSESRSFYVDDQGYYEFRGLAPGRYVVGIGIGDAPVSSAWGRVFYPGVQTREEATVIELGKAEKRTNIDFKLAAPEPH